jgi:polysaccharide export outer membrane protein
MRFGDFQEIMGPRLRQILFAILAMLALTAAAQQTQGDYKLGPGDNIRINVFRNPELTLETRVSEGGSITYPLIGAIEVGGLTIGAAETKIGDALREGGYLQQPQVNIVLMQVRGSQVAVLGLVGRPGRYPLETFNMLLSDILAQAGGISPTGADSLILTGIREGKPFHREIDVAGIFLDQRRENNVMVAGGDVIYVHRSPVYYVYGEIQRPGSYRVERGMFVMQALALAGGPTARGTERRLRLYRRNAAGILEKLSPEMTDEIRADDVLYVNESLF